VWFFHSHDGYISRLFNDAVSTDSLYSVDEYEKFIMNSGYAITLLSCCRFKCDIPSFVLEDRAKPQKTPVNTGDGRTEIRLGYLPIPSLECYHYPNPLSEFIQCHCVNCVGYIVSNNRGKTYEWSTENEVDRNDRSFTGGI
jgi:hypothetical protein